jgi:hypothetical protein
MTVVVEKPFLISLSTYIVYPLLNMSDFFLI